jgi:hypothetical protein
MKPRVLIAALRSLASYIDTSERPSRSFIATRMFGIRVAMQYQGMDNEFASEFKRVFDKLNLIRRSNQIELPDIRQGMKSRFFPMFDDQVQRMHEFGMFDFSPLLDAEKTAFGRGRIQEGVKAHDGTPLYWASDPTAAEPTEKFPLHIHDTESVQWEGQNDQADAEVRVKRTPAVPNAMKYGSNRRFTAAKREFVLRNSYDV